MNVEVRLFATLRAHLPKETGGVTRLEMGSGARNTDVLTKLAIPRNQPLIVIVNGRRASESEPLHDGDRVGIFPPVGGG